MLTLAVVVAVVAAIRGMWSPCGLSMISSLNPVAERARGHRPAVTAAWYVAGAVLGGAVLGAGCALAALGLAPLHLARAMAFGIAAACAAVAVLSDARTFAISLPDHPRQVNERWLGAYRRWIYAAGFGVQIGTGFATYIMTAAVYLAAALAVLSGPGGALLVGLSFGLARGLCVVVSMRAVTPERLRSLLRRIEALDVASLSAVVAVNIAVASVASGVAAGLVPAAAVALLLSAAALLPSLVRRPALQRP
jgi:hypothetical protein